MEKIKSKHGFSRQSILIPLAGALLFLSGCASFQEFAGNEQNPEPTIGAGTSGSINENNGNTTVANLTRPDLDLQICKMKVSNAPDAINRKVSRKSATACVNGVELLVAPAPAACLTSGFGKRPKMHKGVDYQSKPAGKVVAAANGEVLTRGYRAKDFGNWVVIDHGSDVYTAYAHLASIDERVKEGVKLAQGDTLGIMGKTGPSWITAIHLHYEVRVGDIDKAGSYFKLEPLNPFKQPASCPAS